MAMCDEAEGKFGDKVPIPFSFDMSELKRIKVQVQNTRKNTKVNGVRLWPLVRQD